MAKLEVAVGSSSSGEEGKKKENLEEMRSRAKEAINNGFGEELLILGGLWCGVVVVVENGSRG